MAFESDDDARIKSETKTHNGNDRRRQRAFATGLKRPHNTTETHRRSSRSSGVKPSILSKLLFFQKSDDGVDDFLLAAFAVAGCIGRRARRNVHNFPCRATVAPSQGDQVRRAGSGRRAPAFVAQHDKCARSPTHFVRVCVFSFAHWRCGERVAVFLISSGLNATSAAARPDATLWPRTPTTMADADIVLFNLDHHSAKFSVPPKSSERQVYALTGAARRLTRLGRERLRKQRVTRARRVRAQVTRRRRFTRTSGTTQTSPRSLT